jgi:hypothetical protein
MILAFQANVSGGTNLTLTNNCTFVNMYDPIVCVTYETPDTATILYSIQLENSTGYIID